ncbi:hypothetical protein SAMN05442782_1681 [Streptomyces sp. OK228]|nr:hypothetical protein SAMN05442782_1681 [Streptomyces sp. OK228]
MPWVKTCCDTCYYVPSCDRSGREHLSLVEYYEDRG